LTADDDRKAKSREVLEHPRKGGVRQFLETHDRVEIPIDVEVRFGFVEDACLGRLFPRAAILDHLLPRNIRPPIAPDRMLGVFHLFEEILRREPPGPETSRLHRPLDAPEDGLKLGEKGFMFLAGALNGPPLA
jgi:hypothetical protein